MQTEEKNHNERPIKERSLRFNANVTGGILLANLEVTQFAAMIAMVIILLVKIAGNIDLIYSADIMKNLDANSLIIISTAASVLANGVLMSVYGIVRRRSFKVEFEKRNMAKVLPICLLLVFQINLLISGTQEAIDSLFNGSGDYLNSIISSGDFPVMLICIGIVGPIAEEISFRKVVFSSLRKYGFCFAAVVSAALFGLMHQNFSQFLFAFLIGLVLAYSYERSGKLIFPIILHVANNSYAVLAMYGYISELAGLILNVLLLLSFAAMSIIFLVRGGHFSALFDCKAGEGKLFKEFFRQPLVIIYMAVCVVSAVFALVVGNLDLSMLMK